MASTMPTQTRVGTSGWNYAHWKERFYPAGLSQKRWFEHYAGVFDTVEINNTFYRLPEPDTFDHWREQAPTGFVYAVKANQFLTHRKRLKDAQEPLELFLGRARRLRPHLGPILYQLPPRWHRNLRRLEDFCRLLPKGLIHVVEFRDADWLVDETFALLEHYGVCLCIHDMLPRHPRRVTGPALYLRFHGAGERYGGCYRRDQLHRWADWICQAATPQRSVFAYFNNDAEAFAVENACTLREFLRERNRAAPP